MHLRSQISDLRHIGLIGLMLVAAAGQGATYSARVTRPPTPAVITFGVEANVTNTAPYVTAATLGTNDVTWTDPAGAEYRGKTPAYTFFTNAGQYRLSVSDWRRVTYISFYQSSSRAFVTNMVVGDGISDALGWNTISFANTFRGSTTMVSLVMDKIPASCSAMSSCFQNLFALTSPVPDMTFCTNIASLSSCFAESGLMRGPFPDVGRYTKLSTLLAAFSSAGFTGSFATAWGSLKSVTALGSVCAGAVGLLAAPDLNGMTNTSGGANAAFSSCTNMSGCLPPLTNLPLLTSAKNMYDGDLRLLGFPPAMSLPALTNANRMFQYCSSVTSAFPVLTNCPNLADTSAMFNGCFSATGTVDSIFGDYTMLTNLGRSAIMFSGCSNLTGSATNFIVAPKAAGYTVGTASTCNSYRVFYGCTGLTDYATIPAEWK